MVSLKELGLEEAGEAELRRAAEAVCKPEESIHNMSFEITPDMVLEAIKIVDELGQELV